jgi:hypothetical protein
MLFVSVALPHPSLERAHLTSNKEPNTAYDQRE